MSGLFSFLSIISFLILLIGIIVWFIRRKATNRSFSKRSKKIMWASLAIYFISLVGGGIADESETAEIQPLVQAEEAALAEAKELKAEEARLAEEKEELAAQEKAEEERIATEKKVAEAKAAEQALADQKAAEEKAAADQLALEKKAADEKATAERLALEEKAAAERVAAEQASQKQAASAAVSSETFQNCTELRKVYPSGVPAGHAAYQSKMDRDDDAFACEA